MLFHLSCFLIILKILHVQCDFGQYHNIHFNPAQFLKHKTDQFYKVPEGLIDVIVRRAEYFKFSVKLPKKYDKQQVEVQFLFKTQKDVFTVVLPSYNNQRWTISQSAGFRSINVKIYIGEKAPVGAWKMLVIVKDKAGIVIKRIPIPNRVVILFNPWSSADSVYMESEHNLNEYILNEKGILFSYNWNDHKKRLWLYNQFKPGVLDAVLFVLNRADLSSLQRGDPVKVTRDLSWLINVDSSKEGVLQGKWDEPFDMFDGRRASRPTDWLSSTSILYQYYQTNGKPVAYGQCWVFAALFTTILRAIGIPSRPVTAFAAAHDFNGDLTADIRFDNFGFLNPNNSDRIWNFHVWTQAWMSRKVDLKNDIYSGWQDTDSTPQGSHGGRLQVGPASTRAVKEADVRKPYETAFVYMEQNSDEVHWYNDRIKEIKPDSIGLATVTKAVGSDDYEDITHYYKYEEKTAEERLSYKKACSELKIQCPSLQASGKQRARGATVTVSIDMTPVWNIGSAVGINLILDNPSMKDQLVNVALRVTSTYYDGVDGNIIKDIQLKKVQVFGRKKRKLKFDLLPIEYIDKLKDFFTNRVEAVVTNARGQLENDMARLVFIAPQLHIDCPPKAETGQFFTCVVDFQNPLDRPLEDCYFIVEGQRIDREIIKVDSIEAGEESSVKIKLISKHPWHETIVASFVSRTVKDIRGSAEIHITEQSQMQIIE